MSIVAATYIFNFSPSLFLCYFVWRFRFDLTFSLWVISRSLGATRRCNYFTGIIGIEMYTRLLGSSLGRRWETVYMRDSCLKLGRSMEFFFFLSELNIQKRKENVYKIETDGLYHPWTCNALGLYLCCPSALVFIVEGLITIGTFARYPCQLTSG